MYEKLINRASYPVLTGFVFIVVVLVVDLILNIFLINPLKKISNLFNRQGVD